MGSATSLSPESFRPCVGEFATGVTVVIAEQGGDAAVPAGHPIGLDEGAGC